MNVELMLELAKQAKKNRQKISDVSLSFQDIKSRLAFDRAAERLIQVLIFKRWSEGFLCLEESLLSDCRAVAKLKLN